MIRYFVVLVWAGIVMFAAQPSAWEMSTFQDFMKGKLESLQVSKDGRLSPGLALDKVFTPGEPVAWTAVRATDGTVYIATGHRGRVFEIDAQGKGRLLWSAGQAEVFALTLDKTGNLYAGTSPNGKVYRVAKDGKSQEYFDPHERAIWALEFAADGALFVGTGDEGKVYRVTAAGQGELYADTRQAHVTALAVDSKQQLLIGTEPNGIVYRSGAKNQLFSLLDSAYTEVRRILPQADGSLLVVFMGGSASKAMRGVPVVTPPSTSTGSTPTISITVTDADAQAKAALEVKPPAASTGPVPATAATAAAVATTDDLASYNIEKSAIVRVKPDLSTLTLWSSKEENAYDAAVSADGKLLVGTDLDGHLYQMEMGGTAALLASQRGETIVRVLGGKPAMLLTASAGSLFRVGVLPVLSGTFTSPVHDANFVSRWGQLTCRSTGNQLQVETRTGNAAMPDSSWSTWSTPAPVTAAACTAKIASPSARFIQWRATLTDSTQLDRMTANYQTMNRAPVVKTVTVTSTYNTIQALRSAGASAASQAATAASTFSVTVTDSGEVSNSSPAGTPTQTMVRQTAPQLILVWSAEDGDGDRLSYDVDVRAEGEDVWQSLKKATTDTSISIENELLGEGSFLFRVRASDRLSNSLETALDAQLVSASVLIDLTPPAVTVSTPERTKEELKVVITALDAVSPIRRCEYAVDGGAWQPVDAQAGVADSLSEVFVARMPAFASGNSHWVVFRVQDAAENSAMRRILVR